MDKLRQAVNVLFITVYVVMGVTMFGLIMIRNGNEQQGLHLFEVFAPYIVNIFGISFAIHLLLSCIVPRTSKR